MKKLEYILLTILIVSSFANAYLIRCLHYEHVVREADRRYLGKNFPWWFSIGQLEAESDCTWETSIDGWGSIGPAQLTPQFEGRILDPLFPDWERPYSRAYFYGYAYVMATVYRKEAYCPDLWNMFQCYNRSCWEVNREARQAHCDYTKARDICYSRYLFYVCVWKQDGICRQYRSNCSINYDYSRNIWIYGLEYKPKICPALPTGVLFW